MQAEHHDNHHAADPTALVQADSPYLGKLSGNLLALGGIMAAVGLIGAVVLGVGANDGMRGFWFSYLLGFVYLLSISLGALVFVAIQHLTRASWSVVVRRIAEYVSANMLLVAVLAIPILVVGLPSLYSWLSPETIEPEHLRHLVANKAAYLNRSFFTVRLIGYFIFWIWLSRYFLGHSLKQDSNGDPELTKRMWVTSAPGTLLYALTSTFAAFDLIMSLSPGWFSTIFGVYFFAGCFVGFMSLLALTVAWLQSRGHLRTSITPEHYHDIGKLTFAFTLFWAYIGFSQFMLIWYGNLPEETFWYILRTKGPWLTWAVVLLFGHFFIPFAGLMSRWVKRKLPLLVFWCCWQLVMHWMDLAWLILPEWRADALPNMLLPILATVGLSGLYIAVLALSIGGKAIVPLRDPRLAESLQFDNIKV
jgi:hypothetical protein